jgi:hypothetical protein
MGNKGSSTAQQRAASPPLQSAPAPNTTAKVLVLGAGGGGKSLLAKHLLCRHGNSKEEGKWDGRPTEPSKGIRVETLSFPEERLGVQLVDVGGRRHERRKWLFTFDDVKLVLFVVNMTWVNQTLVVSAPGFGSLHVLPEGGRIHQRHEGGAGTVDRNLVSSLARYPDFVFLFAQKLQMVQEFRLLPDFHTWG